MRFGLIELLAGIVSLALWAGVCWAAWVLVGWLV